MIEKHEITDPNIPVRQYPKFKVIDELREVDLVQGKAQIPKAWGYYQYLILVIYPLIFGKPFLGDPKQNSVLSKLYVGHVKKSVSSSTDTIHKSSNADAYLLYLGSDLELLFIKNQLPESHIRRLRSTNDGEMRGVIWELSAAAGFIRAGYDIAWLIESSKPEFSASKDSVTVDVESKRRNRTGIKSYDLEREVKAIRQNLADALKKKRDNKYLIILDTDLPPASSTDYESIFNRLATEFKNYNLRDTAVVISHYGFEHDPDNIHSGKTSALIFQGKGSFSAVEIKRILNYVNAKLPAPISIVWQT